MMILGKKSIFEFYHDFFVWLFEIYWFNILKNINFFKNTANK